MATENQSSLVSTIRGLHVDLRKQYQACKDQESVNLMWDEHCKKEAILKQYAFAMYQLANYHWKCNNYLSTRIEWCRNIIMEYFFNGGIQKEFKKDLKMALASNIKENNSFEHIAKLWLLDVGSCYNPFKEYEEFSSVALDICPATNDVYKCDFLKLKVTSCGSEDEMTHCLTSLSSTVYSLPKGSFDVVVFSLLLEYLPSQHQRLLCCIKALNFLKRNGLLLIITPDSKHQNHNAKMMKSWKLALESIGFKRIKYEKQTHLHCLAFRKVPINSSDSIKSSLELSTIAHQLFIPQDFHDYSIHSNLTESCEEIGLENRSDRDLEELKFGFMQLPQL